MDDDAGLDADELGVGKVGQYMRLLQYLAEAINPGFQRASAAASDPTGATSKNADTKTGRRMAVKRTTDHKDAKQPKFAENVDMARNCKTAKDKAMFEASFDSQVAAFGAPLQVKNNYRADFDALAESHGYRALTAIFLYAPEGKTWGELFDTEMDPEKKAVLRAKIAGDPRDKGLLDVLDCCGLGR